MGEDEPGHELGADQKGVVRELVKRVCRALPLGISTLTIAAGYYLIWSVALEEELKTVLFKTRAGLLLIINGGLLLAVSLHRLTK